MKKVNTIVSVVAILGIMGGCSATKINLDSQPSGARVTLNGKQIGTTQINNYKIKKKEMPLTAVAKKYHYFDDTLLVVPDKSDYTFHLVRKTTELPDVTFNVIPVSYGVPSVSIDSRTTIAYVEAIEKSPNVKAVEKITNNYNTMAQISQLSIDPINDGEDVVVYVMYYEEDSGKSYSNIWKQKVGDFRKTKITSGKWLDLYPHFTPNGNSVVFSSNRMNGSASTLCKVDLNAGKGITNISHSNNLEQMPFVSPDGKKIFYSSFPMGANEPQIWSVDIDGRYPTQIRAGAFPQISPDGKKILYEYLYNSVTQIWCMNTDGTGESQLTQNQNYDCMQPRWSPDGQTIVFASNCYIPLYSYL